MAINSLDYVPGLWTVNLREFKGRAYKVPRLADHASGQRLMCCKKVTYHVAHGPLHEFMALCPPIAAAMLVSHSSFIMLRCLALGVEAALCYWLYLILC